LFFHERLIVGYVHNPENDCFVFQLSGGEEFPVSQEEFVIHWQEYREFEEERASQHTERYRPLPVTLVVRRSVQLFPGDPSLRRKRKSA